MDLLSLWACRHYSVQWTQVCDIIYRYLLHVCLQVCDIICKTKELKYLMSQHKSPPRTGFSRTFLLGIEDIFVIIFLRFNLALGYRGGFSFNNSPAGLNLRVGSADRVLLWGTRAHISPEPCWHKGKGDPQSFMLTMYLDVAQCCCCCC